MIVLRTCRVSAPGNASSLTKGHIVLRYRDTCAFYYPDLECRYTRLVKLQCAQEPWNADSDSVDLGWSQRYCISPALRSADPAGLWSIPWGASRYATKTQQAQENPHAGISKTPHMHMNLQFIRNLPGNNSQSSRGLGPCSMGNVSTCPGAKKGYALWVLLKHLLVLSGRGCEDKTVASVQAVRVWGRTEKDRAGQSGYSPWNKCFSCEMGLGFLLNSRTQTPWEPGSLHLPSTTPEMAVTSLTGPSFSAAPGSEKQGASGRRALWRAALVLLPRWCPGKMWATPFPFLSPRLSIFARGLGCISVCDFSYPSLCRLQSDVLHFCMLFVL